MDHHLIRGKRRRTDWRFIQVDWTFKQVRHEDRLSFLPDEALSRIFRMLPTKDAAVTTLISNKFMPAFSLLNSFDFDDSPISHCVRSPNLVERTPGFKNFVDYVLRACQSKQLGRFTLCFGRFCGDKKRRQIDEFYECKGGCYPYLEPARLNAWISFPLARSVTELDLCINVQTSPGYPKLPRSIFVCETLEMLKLDSNLDLDVDDDVKAFPIRLPRLKLLHLRTLFFAEDEFVTKLIESCPVLEDLLMACWWESGDVFAISSPSLLNLNLTLNKYKNELSTNVIINTPNLQSFKYEDNISNLYSIPNMNALDQADIAIIMMEGREESCWNLCSILKSCSTVSHLSLKCNSLLCIDHYKLEDYLPMFHNLTHLELSYTSMVFWDILLVEFLNCSPSLQTLVFPEVDGLCWGRDDPCHQEEEVIEGYRLERECWGTTQAILSCCKSHLKNIVIKKYHGLQRELDLIQFLLGKASVLESVDISISVKSAESAGVNLHPLVVEHALLKIPRASRFCSIRVE